VLLRRDGSPATPWRASEPPRPVDPRDIGRTPGGKATTQAALGRALLDLSRSAPEAAKRIVTLCPDVSSSTNLGGWVNKVGVWSARERVDWFADDPETILHWREQPGGQHLELGIAETNLVGLLGELGATWSRWGQPLLPIGVLYDPFVERALEPWSFGVYAGGQSILVGTPSGVTLAPEGGAHQSITTPSVGWSNRVASPTSPQRTGDRGRSRRVSDHLRYRRQWLPGAAGRIPRLPSHPIGTAALRNHLERVFATQNPTHLSW